MTTVQKLELAFELVKKAENVLQEIRYNKDDNESLLDYYGYSLEIIEQQLNIFSDNRKGYLTSDTNIKEIIESEGDKWDDNSKDDRISYDKVLEQIYI